MEHLDSLFDRYRRILVFDTETTGVTPGKDEIIQFSAVLLEREQGKTVISRTYNELLSLAPGKVVPPEITRLTGITTEDVQSRGIPRERACREIAQLVEGPTLLAAYNAQFDLTFLFYLLAGFGEPRILQRKDKLDLLTVYRDRRSYPHKLLNAIEAYQLSGTVQNSHSADDDALAAAWVMDAMAAEKNDLLAYINVFGYIPKFGKPRPAIGSVTYAPQPYNAAEALYLSLQTVPENFCGTRFTLQDLARMGQLL